MRTFNINADLYNKLYYSLECKQNDDITIQLNILENGVASDLTNATFSFNFVKADNTIVNVAGSNITVNSSAVTIVCPVDATRAVGVARCELVIVKACKQTTTFDIGINVLPSVIQGQAVSKNVATIVDEIYNANTTATNTKQQLDDWVQAHGDIVDLDNRVQNNTTQLSKKANQSDLDFTNSIVTTKTNDTDSNRTTTSKTVTGAINELNSNKSEQAYVDAEFAIKRNNTDKILLADLADEVKQAMAGTTPINATPGDNTISNPKLETILKNKIDNTLLMDTDYINKLTVGGSFGQNGGVIYNNGGKIPSGYSGNTAYRSYELNVSQLDASIGEIIICYLEVQFSSNFVAQGKTYSIYGNISYSDSTTGSNVATILETEDLGNNIKVFVLKFTLPKKATKITSIFQIADNKIVTEDIWFNLYNVGIYIEGSDRINTSNLKTINRLVVKNNSQITSYIDNTILENSIHHKLDIDSRVISPKNGAIISGNKLTIPTGLTGNATYYQILSLSNNNGDFNLRSNYNTFYILINHSANLFTNKTLELILNAYDDSGTITQGVGINSKFININDNCTCAIVEYNTPSNIAKIAPYILVTGSPKTNEDVWFELKEITYIQNIIDSISTAQKEIDNIYNKMENINNSEIVRLVVAKDGTGDFLSPKLACDSITDSSPNKWYEIFVKNGVYTETEWTVSPYTIIRGENRELCELRGELPNNALDSAISYTSTIWLKKTCKLFNLKITAKNMRYAIHSEESGANSDCEHILTNCEVIHYGNQGVRDWRNANPSSGLLASTVWASTMAYGYGSASGLYEQFNECIFTGYEIQAWASHANMNFNRDNVNEFNNCVFSTRGDVSKIVLSSTSSGSGTNNKNIFNSCNFSGGYIGFSKGAYLNTDESNLYAHLDYRVIFNNCNSTPIHMDSWTRCLKIQGVKDTDIIQIDGTAISSLFGDVINKNGGGGILPYAYGSWDISGTKIGLTQDTLAKNTIGKRLGNCSTTTKTLIITINGINHTITFNKDYTSLDNATIISEMNSNIRAVALASVYDSVANEDYPTIIDKEIKLKNSSTDGIQRFTPVCYNNDINSIRPMLSTDSKDKFLGIALENIVPNSIGRVLTEGTMFKTQMLGLENLTFTFGDDISVGNKTFLKDSSNVIGKAVFSEWIYFKGNKY
ncbi:BppU family phage baseplate upper protein [Inconstantimicrobium mannanitabidum]|uniref:Uncharacterized protein n=1 Tax=Inconstantimicrobium mannanitabidum TaxID=1604901 RepID=A0ACB5R9H7_9CLOT|nr:hypothetical protein [Clostridium sp. TW13]GKX65843.1 hypothetical protein rsdtw13_11010 [Clostridium sp. TW13]